MIIWFFSTYSLVVWFMGHGDLHSLQLKDDKIDRRADFIEPFAKIEWLKMKPKLFFIEACAVKPPSKEKGISSYLTKN